MGDIPRLQGLVGHLMSFLETIPWTGDVGLWRTIEFELDCGTSGTVKQQDPVLGVF